MDIERLKELREETEQYRAVADDRCMSTNYEDDLLELIDEALQAYQPTISKTETTTCEWCDSGIDTASVMSTDMMMRFVRPVNYCPNCGRRLVDCRADGYDVIPLDSILEREQISPEEIYGDIL